MLRKLRIPIIIVVTAVLTQAIGFAVHAGLPDTLRPAGSTRYAVASADSDFTDSTTWSTIAGLSQSISIPAGKYGDVFISYCADQNGTFAGELLRVRALLGGSSALPASALLPVESTSFYVTKCASFYKLNVPDGSRTVRMQWAAQSEGEKNWIVQGRMIVTINIHD